MFTRVVHCTLKPEHRTEFNQILNDKVLPEIQNQPGFISLLGFISDENPDHALAVTFWKTRQDANRYYQGSAPIMDYLKPLVKSADVEHFNVEGELFQAKGKAA